MSNKNRRAAGVADCFENFTEDFVTCGFFYGLEGGERTEGQSVNCMEISLVVSRRRTVSVASPET